MGNGTGERDESGQVQPLAAPASWEGLLAMALLWAVPVVGFLLAMLLGGSHP